MQIACEFRLIKTAGAWYTIQCALDEVEEPVVSKILKENEVGEKEEDIERFFKFQGVNNLTEFLNENPPMCDFIYSKIKELF